MILRGQVNGSNDDLVFWIQPDDIHPTKAPVDFLTGGNKSPVPPGKLFGCNHFVGSPGCIFGKTGSPAVLPRGFRSVLRSTGEHVA